MIAGYFAVDYNVHSHRSYGGNAAIAQLCDKAVTLGLNEIGFAEYLSFDMDTPAGEALDYDAYMAEIEAARRRWGSQLAIRAGVEIDFQVCFEDRIARYLDQHDFDFTIGSVYAINRVEVMSPEYNSHRNARLAYSDYFKAVCDSVLSGCFDVLGHLEYANRRGIGAWGPYHPAAHINQLADIFDHMIEENMALEINTSGLKHSVAQTYPCSNTLELFAERGGKLISIGSNANAPEYLANGYGSAVQAAIDHGVTHLCTYERRHRTVVPFKHSSSSTLQKTAARR